MKLIYPDQSVASALRSLVPGIRIRAYAMRATDNISGSPRPRRGTCEPRDTIIWRHLEVHPARPSDKGLPSFSGTREFNHATRQIDVNVEEIYRAAWSFEFS